MSTKTIHGMDHDRAKENWTRQPNRNPGCACPPWRYTPQYNHLRETNPACPQHGTPQPAPDTTT